MVVKRIVCVVLSVLSFQLLFAQLKFGLSAGLNLSSTREQVFDKFLSHTFLPRANAGADLEYFFDPHWGIATGAYYSGKGYRIRFPLDYDSVILRLNYIEVPLKLSYRFTGGNSALITSAGFYGAYGLSGRRTVRNNPQLTRDPFKNDQFQRFDFGYVLESTYQVTRNYAVRIGYSHALTNLTPDHIIRNFLFDFSLLWQVN